MLHLQVIFFSGGIIRGGKNLLGHLVSILVTHPKTDHGSGSVQNRTAQVGRDLIQILVGQDQGQPIFRDSERISWMLSVV